jgi:hypothetical protein
MTATTIRRTPVAVTPTRRGPQPPWPRRHLRALLAGAVALALVASIGVVLGLRTGSLRDGGVLSVVLQQDQESGSVSAGTRSAIEAAALRMSSAGGGTMTIRVGSTGRATSVATAELTVVRDGNPESQADLRAAAIRTRVRAAFVKAASARTSASGRALAELLAGAADDVAHARGPREIWVRSLGLPTVDPTDVRVLMNAEPAAAVASLPASAFADLRGAEVHWIFPSTTGDQPALNLRTEQWRAAFLTEYVKASRGVLASTQDERGTGPAAAGSPAVPVVPNLPDPTPVPPKHENGTLTTSIDTASLFRPDEAQLIDEGQAIEQLRPLAAAWATGRYASIVCTGRIAAFGPPGSPVGQRLSEQRAAVIVGLLRRLDTPATPVGVGATRPLPGDPRGAVQRSVTCVATPVATDH